MALPTETRAVRIPQTRTQSIDLDADRSKLGPRTLEPRGRIAESSWDVSGDDARGAKVPAAPVVCRACRGPPCQATLNTLHCTHRSLVSSKSTTLDPHRHLSGGARGIGGSRADRSARRAIIERAKKEGTNGRAYHSWRSSPPRAPAAARVRRTCPIDGPLAAELSV